MQGCGNKDFCPFEEFKVNTPRPTYVEPSHSRDIRHFFFLFPVIWRNVSHWYVVWHVQEKIVKPHLKHDYNMICKIKPPLPKEGPAWFSSLVWKFFAGLFSGYRVVSAEDIESEL
jgi:hypothetical protein